MLRSPMRIGLGAAAAVWLWLGTPASVSADPLLEEVVEFTGSVFYFQHKVPGLVIGAVRDGEIAIHGVGERSDGGKVPDADTVLTIGSITKAFTGQVLASLVADGTVSLTDRLGKVAPDFGKGKDPNLAKIRLIDLATQSAGLPRDADLEPADDTATQRDIAEKWIAEQNLLYPPGTGVLYSNLGFDLLAIGLSETAKTTYPELLQDRVTGPLGLTDTTYTLDADQKSRLMQGHGFDGKPVPNEPEDGIIGGAGSLYSTPKDLLTWMKWHLDRLSDKDAEIRMLDHAVYLVRDGLEPVYGMDESGHMDAMSLGWVVMMPEGDRPLILQKAGGQQGTFTYIAFAPTRGIAAFIAINTFDFSAAMAMAEVVNDMIATLAPR